MNILILGWRDPKHPLAGGAEQSVMEHAKGWRDAGNKVVWFSSRFTGSSPKEMVDGIEVVRCGHQYLGVQITAFFYYLKNKKVFDFVIDQFHGIPFFTPLYIRKPKLALIQETAREVWFLNPLPFPLNKIIGILGYALEPLIFFLFYRSTPFITGSASGKKELIEMGIKSGSITIVPHGVIVKKPEKKIKKEDIPTITFLGILSKDKGVDVAVKTFGILNKKRKFAFWVIGRGENRGFEARLKSLVKKLKLQKKIKFWGYVNQEKKFELLARSHILINPSIREGWGLVNIEANAVGTPVVSYASPGLVDSVKDGVSGIICRQNNPENLAENILFIISDKAKYEKLSLGAISWSNNFNWDKSRKFSLDLIEKIYEAR